MTILKTATGVLLAALTALTPLAIAPAAQVNGQLIKAIGKLPIGDARTLSTASLGINVGQGPYSSVTVNEPQHIRVNLSTTVPGADGMI